MENAEIINVGFKIISTDTANNCIAIRPTSDSFKKDEDSYPAFNINITNLNPSKDIEEQIIEMLQPTVKAIIDSENDQFVDKVKEFVKTNHNKVISANKKINKPTEETTHITDVVASSDSFEIIT